MTNTESIYSFNSYESVFTNKIAFIKVVRDHTGCSLIDAKNLVDSFIASCDAVKKSDASFLEQVRQIIANSTGHYATDMFRVSAIVENWREANPF
jgi:ribosomal protein L7/L12